MRYTPICLVGVPFRRLLIILIVVAAGTAWSLDAQPAADAQICCGSRRTSATGAWEVVSISTRTDSCRRVRGADRGTSASNPRHGLRTAPVDTGAGRRGLCTDGGAIVGVRRPLRQRRPRRHVCPRRARGWCLVIEIPGRPEIALQPVFPGCVLRFPGRSDQVFPRCPAPKMGTIRN